MVNIPPHLPYDHPDSEALRQKARALIDAGVLPAQRNVTTQILPGSARHESRCVVCEAVIGLDETNWYRLVGHTYTRDGSQLSPELHAECHAAWHQVAGG
jgi:hypothetical protein